MNVIARFTSILFALIALGVAAQEAPGSDIYRTAMELDSKLFDEGFNDCRLDDLAVLTAPGLRFFHDVGGQQDRAAFLAGMKRAICSSPESKPIRKRIADASQVFPLRDKGELYGIIHQGRHEFHLLEPGRPLRATNVARFTLVWIRGAQGWQLDTALSFDHRKP